MGGYRGLPSAVPETRNTYLHATSARGGWRGRDPRRTGWDVAQAGDQGGLVFVDLGSDGVLGGMCVCGCGCVCVCVCVCARAHVWEYVRACARERVEDRNYDREGERETDSQTDNDNVSDS